MLGWTEEELRGKPDARRVHFQRADGTPVPEDECELLKVRTQGPQRPVADDAFTRKDGSIFPVAYSAAPLLERPDRHGVVVVFRDTTEENSRADARAARARRADLGRAHPRRPRRGPARPVLPADRPARDGRPSEELLLRMIGRDGEIILPGSFLPVAEKYGLIGEIDRWVITQAIRLPQAGGACRGEPLGRVDRRPRTCSASSSSSCASRAPTRPTSSSRSPRPR